MEDAWTGTNEAARDLHRGLEQQRLATGNPSLAQTDGQFRSLPDEQRLYPEAGVASDYKHAGGFRREHLQDQLQPGESLPQYAATSLLHTINHGGGEFEWLNDYMVTDVVQKMEDGAEIRFESRLYRRGRRPKIVRLPTGLTPEEPPLSKRLKVCGWRPHSVPYWVSLTFLIGAILFTEGSFAWMIPSVGDEAHGAPLWEARATVTYPYFVGSTFFLIGCYLAFVEVINANLHEELKGEGPDPNGSVHAPNSIHRSHSRLRVPSDGSTTGGSPSGRRSGRRSSRVSLASQDTLVASSYDELAEQPHEQQPDDPAAETCLGWLRSLHWWRFQPGSLLWWAALVQLLSAVVFEVACIAGLPGVIEGHAMEVAYVFIPSLVGSVGFTFASWVYLMEVTHSANPLHRPQKLSFGYLIALLNLGGSLNYTIASCFYFAPEGEEEPPLPGGEAPYDAAYYYSEWGVRFLYGVGSLCFVAGTALSFPELLSDD